jgi:hypothetical protein
MRKRTRKGASWADSGFVRIDWRWARRTWGRDMGGFCGGGGGGGVR